MGRVKLMGLAGRGIGCILFDQGRDQQIKPWTYQGRMDNHHNHQASGAVLSLPQGSVAINLAYDRPSACLGDSGLPALSPPVVCTSFLCT